MEVELRNMFTLSETHPKIKEVMISRESYLDFFERQFEEDKVLCVDGPEGVGVTTALAMFTQKHAENCASYFNNGWSRHLLNPQVIVQSLLSQLSHYTKSDLNPNEKETSLSQCIYKLSRATRNRNKYLYFVFDGFNRIPVEYVDVIKAVLQPLFNLENGRFLFSGTVDGIKQLLPESANAKQSNSILRFESNDVQNYLHAIDPDLGADDISTIYELSGKGLARKLAILTEKLQKEGMDKIRAYYSSMEEDFYAEDFEWIEAQDDKNLSLLMTLLAFSERPLNRKLLMHTLKQPEEVINALLEKCKDYVEEENGLITLKSDDYRKYLRTKLTDLKTDIELLLIDQIEQSNDTEEQFVFLPALYKHVNKDKLLVKYLTSDNVQHYLEEKKSQAALNEQCEYGYNACSDFETQAGAFFRFAINRSVSREIEKNELSDAEIEALIAIGDDEQAYALTQNVYLLEERLKCLLIIAQAGKHLSDAMSEEIDAQITTLADSIDYAHMPDKALELAKLMMPVKMEKALEIIDKVAKVTKDQQQIDRLYTAISISYNNEGKNENDNAAKADLVSTKIADEGLRKMATVMKSIMKDSTAQQVVAKMKELPQASSQLYFLNYWIPDHRKREDIGDAVEYAVKLVIDTSTTTMPKVALLRHFCMPLPKMKEAQIRNVVSMLDAVVANIKYPTIEYVKLMILVISAVVKFDKTDAENRIQALYLEILELKDKALQAHCKALLLRDYEKLGEKKDVENWLMESFKLQDEIFDDVEAVLKESAYHMKVVEGPIKALVCGYPTFVKDVIAKMNTKERRNRAYLLAATEYVRQTDIKKLDWKYFIKLYSQITYDESELYKPLLDLVNKIIEVKDKDEKLLANVIENYGLFTEIEQAEMVCYFLSSLYVWVSRYYTDECFQDMLRADLERAWNMITAPWLKVNTGYNIAKVLSKISMKNEARDYVRKAAELRKQMLLSSLSCVAAYGESLELYAHSLGILIRSGLCGEEDIEQFKKLLSYDNSEGDAMILWSRVALEYYGVDDLENFDKIMTNYVSKPLDKFAGDSQKKILFHISPALYLSLKSLFYSRVEGYDTCFKNACIENIARYVQTKYPYPEYTSSNMIEAQIPLQKKDYDILLDLIENSDDEAFIFNQTEIITKSIDRSVGRKLSREIQRAVLNSLEDIVRRKLPMKDGIQHDGYLISCLAMINNKKTENLIEASAFRTMIEAVPNQADQAFLYAHVACYLKKTADKAQFIELAMKKTEGISYTFDRFNRLNLCMQESFTATPSKAKEIATKVIKKMQEDKNGSYEDYQRMLDLVRDHDEQLADSMLEMVDDDPARVQYKKMLKLRAASSKKIEAAKNDLTQVKRLSNDEQVQFYDKQMECLIKKKNVVRDMNTTQSVIASIYDHPITETQNAALYFMENVYQKNVLNGKYKVLLREMHQAILYNLKIVLAIASGTKEKLERVNRIMNERVDDNENMIQVNQADKGVQRIVEWYKEHPVDVLRIIDPHFHGEDLFIIKMLMDINNDLKCFILMQNETGETLNDQFQNGWNAFSAELTGRIEVKSCCYEDQPEKSPIHDRWWLLYDDNTDEYYGKRMSSPSTFGSRITEISDVDADGVKSAKLMFNRFFVNMVPKDEERKLKYEETILR